MKDWSHDVLNGGIQRKLEELTEKSECVVLYCMNDLFSWYYHTSAWLLSMYTLNTLTGEPICNGEAYTSTVMSIAYVAA